MTTPWYKKKLETLAVDLWENRYLLFKAEQRMTDEEKERTFTKDYDHRPESW